MEQMTCPMRATCYHRKNYPTQSPSNFISKNVRTVELGRDARNQHAAQSAYQL